MTHAEFLHQAVVEIAEELPGFDDLYPVTQQSLRESGERYFDEEFVPRLEGIVNIPQDSPVSLAHPSRKDRIFKPDKFSRHGRQSPIERKPTLAWSTGQPRWRSGPFGGGEMGTAPFGGGTATYF